MIFFRIYQVLIVIPTLVVATIVASVVTIIMCAFTKGRFWGYYPAKIWAILFCWLNFVSVKVDGRQNIDPKTSYVFVANHQGAYDIFSLYGFLGHNFKWMMKSSLAKIPFVGYACRSSGHIFVDRTNANSIRQSMDKARKQLSRGMSLVVFPEGSRSRTGRIGAFKRGAFFLATELSLPVVPITIDGAYNILPRSTAFPRPGRITLTIHKPIEPDSEGHHDLNKLMETSKQAIESGFKS